MTQPAPELLAVLTSGGDERIIIDPSTGTNRYHLNPLDFDGLLHRGSCTVGVVNPDSLHVAEAFLEHHRSTSYERLVGEQADRLRSLLEANPAEEVDIFFAPSGTDLPLYPVLFQHVLEPGRTVTNIVTCPEELGSGSVLAGAGRFFSKRNQFGETVQLGEPIVEGIDARVITLPARSPGGRIIDRRASLRSIVDAHGDDALIGSLVLGSKSGISDDLEIIDEFPDSVMWVVDMCQFRVEPELISSLLAKGVLVMLTGSKFFEAPPFAAALLVPRRWTERLQGAAAPQVAGFSKVFSAFDLPARLDALREQLGYRQNEGLRLRWQIALGEMEAFAALPQATTETTIARWNSSVVDRLGRSSSVTLMPDQDRTNPSIISFQVQHQGQELGHDALVELHRSLVTSRHSGLTAGFDRFYIGQPVRYGDRSFIRLALGSPTVRAMAARGETVFDDDLAIIEIIERSLDA